MILEQIFGKMDKDWILLRQSSSGKDEKRFDEMEIQVLEGELKGKKITLYFDITEFFNNWGKKV